MEALLEHVEWLANSNNEPSYLPISNRVAYIAASEDIYLDNGVSLKSGGMIDNFVNLGFEPICFVCSKEFNSFTSYKYVYACNELNGIRYVHNFQRLDSKSYLEWIENTTDCLVSQLKIFRPSSIFIESIEKLGLPGYIAAKRLKIPLLSQIYSDFYLTSHDVHLNEQNIRVQLNNEKDVHDFIVRQSSRLLVFEDELRSSLIDNGVVPEKIQCFSNDLMYKKTKQFNTSNATDECKIIGVLSDGAQSKIIDDLLLGCSKLTKPHSKVCLLIIDCNNSISTESQLKRYELMQSDIQVEFATFSDHEQLEDHIKRVDVLVVSSCESQINQLDYMINAVKALQLGKRLLIEDEASLSKYIRRFSGVLEFSAQGSSNLGNMLHRLLTLNQKKVNEGFLWSSSDESFIWRLGEIEKKEGNIPLKLTKPTQKHVDENVKARFAAATKLFYREGAITQALDLLKKLSASGAKFDKSMRDFQGSLSGLARLKEGVFIPPRQPNPGYMVRRNNILYCLHQSLPYVTNGYATRSHGIAVGLQNSGYNVRVATRSGFPWDIAVGLSGKGYLEFERDGVSYASCAGWSLQKAPLDFYIAETADHFVREAQMSGAEMIVSASNHITALPALIAARRLGVPFVYEIRGLWEVTQASTQPEWGGSERYHLMRELEQHAALQADFVITLTEELADEVKSWGVRPEQISVVPNAVNEEHFRPLGVDFDIAKSLNLESDVPVIGYAGSVVAYEGLDLLMQALAILKQKGCRFTFVLVGDGKAIESIKKEAKLLGIENECRFTGRVAFEDVPKYMSCMDIMPIPRLSSNVTEMVSALKPLEAMAMGKALLLSDVSPHLTMAGEREERARLFKKDDVESLSESLQSLIDSPDERKKLGDAARSWILSERTWSRVTQVYATALKTVARNTQSELDTNASSKNLKQITLGLIADEFTTDTLASAVRVVRLSPDNWLEEIKGEPIDAVFVESAWKGNNSQWYRKVGYYGEDDFRDLKQLLTYCRENDIPSLFWNKEDPVHFERFRHAASLCDHIFTTDSRRIIPYLAQPETLCKTASSAPFYASLKIHNLLPSNRSWQQTAAYGGTYYGERYPERTEYMDKIMSAAAPLGLTIYDRQHDDPESPYKYPVGLGDYVVGSLSYEEMIQAYKSHPVQINVNSVVDSPTMFSRRVIETAACGSPIVSGPALGMNRYLDGAGQVISNESEAAQALENLLNDPAYRWRLALKGARAISRAHTTEQRLTQMLRTAGFVIAAPEIPDINLYSDEITENSAERILLQTLRPKKIIAKHWKSDTKAQLQEVGIVCSSEDNEHIEEDNLWLISSADSLDNMEAEDIEDLAWPTLYAPHDVISFSRDESVIEDEWPGVAFEKESVNIGFSLVRAKVYQSIEALRDWSSNQRALILRKPSERHERPSNDQPTKTMVIAGHDLKFIKPFYPYFSRSRIRVLLDVWAGHNKHNESSSKRLLSQADIIFCEWMLGNAIWYAKNKSEGQRLIGRLHAQELRSKLFERVPFSEFDKIIFVGAHMLNKAKERDYSLKNNGVVIHNGVNTKNLTSVPRKLTNGKVLGLVGMVPQSKRFDRALDILKLLRANDREYTLRIKGKRPSDYPWMVGRAEEMSWYEEQYKRVMNDEDLVGAVFFDAHGDDMPEWYSGINFILSVSEHESFHLAVAEGAAAGCIPVVFPWEGAEDIYPSSWIFENEKSASNFIKRGYIESPAIRNFSIENFDINSIYKKIFSCI